MALRDTQELSVLLTAPTGALVRDTQELSLLVTSATTPGIRDTQELVLLIQVIGFRHLVTGGNFQDSAGNPLAGGTLRIELSSDAVSVDGLQLGAGRVVFW